MQIPSHDLPWEKTQESYPSSLASPLQILLEASNGASDYGNKFGEPLIAGFTRTFGQRLPNAERREWIKPIMFSGGFGQIDRAHHDKAPPEIGMLVVKIGGPAYRIGIGGGAASSVPGGTRGGETDLDFNAVQRGDAEMSQKLWRVVRACVELGDQNPIVQVGRYPATRAHRAPGLLRLPCDLFLYASFVDLCGEQLRCCWVWYCPPSQGCVVCGESGMRLATAHTARKRRCALQCVLAAVILLAHTPGNVPSFERRLLAALALAQPTQRARRHALSPPSMHACNPIPARCLA